MPTKLSDKGFPCPPEKCRPKRHMTASEFMTYDAMVGCAKSDPEWKEGLPLKFHGRLTTVGNYNGRGAEQEGENMTALEKKGWLERLPRLGSHGRTRHYRVLEHAEFLAAHLGSCPPFKYDPATGDYVGDGVMPPAFAEKLIRQNPGKTGRVKIWHDGDETGKGLAPAGKLVATVEFDQPSSRENSRLEKEEPKE